MKTSIDSTSINRYIFLIKKHKLSDHESLLILKSTDIKVLKGKIVSVDSVGVSFDPQRKGLFYNPDECFYPFDRIDILIGPNKKIIYISNQNIKNDLEKLLESNSDQTQISNDIFRKVSIIFQYGTMKNKYFSENKLGLINSLNISLIKIFDIKLGIGIEYNWFKQITSFPIFLHLQLGYSVENMGPAIYFELGETFYTKSGNATSHLYGAGINFDLFRLKFVSFNFRAGIRKQNWRQTHYEKRRWYVNSHDYTDINFGLVKFDNKITIWNIAGGFVLNL